MPGYWEFPGGKCEPDELPEQAAVRECCEESGLVVSVRRLRRTIEHHYPHGFVQLHYFDCVPRDRDAEPAPDTGFRWVALGELVQLAFPEANELILQDLAGSEPINE